MERRKTLAEYAWSSHAIYAGGKPPPAWVSTDWLGYFAPQRKEAQQRYGRFVENAFGSIVENRWENLRAGKGGNGGPGADVFTGETAPRRGPVGHSPESRAELVAGRRGGSTWPTSMDIEMGVRLRKSLNVFKPMPKLAPHAPSACRGSSAPSRRLCQVSRVAPYDYDYTPLTFHRLLCLGT